MQNDHPRKLVNIQKGSFEKGLEAGFLERSMKGMDVMELKVMNNSLESLQDKDSMVH